jgi:hypothetical protein
MIHQNHIGLVDARGFHALRPGSRFAHDFHIIREIKEVGHYGPGEVVVLHQDNPNLLCHRPPCARGWQISFLGKQKHRIGAGSKPDAAWRIGRGVPHAALPKECRNSATYFVARNADAPLDTLAEEFYRHVLMLVFANRRKPPSWFDSYGNHGGVMHFAMGLHPQ